MTEHWYVINDVDKLDTPALVIYPESVRHNIALAKEMIGDVSRLRPHVKTHKCREATLLMLEAGITKFKCATIAEAEMLGMCKAPDVLLAYQPIGPKLERFIKLIKTYRDTQYSCLVDNIAAAEHISVEALQQKLQISVYIDLNVGQNRTGITPAGALELYIALQELNGLKVLGLHAYDGHLHDTDLAVRIQKCEAAFEQVTNLKNQLVQKGYSAPVIIAGGSPTFPIHAKKENVECSPGTFVYWDRGYSLMCSEQGFWPAAVVVSRVISMPDETKVCLDVGHKSVSAENDISKRIYFMNAPGLTPISQSEEHLVCEAGAGHRYQVGDVFYGMPYHVCPTIALYERAITLENNHITGEWMNVARDRKISV